MIQESYDQQPSQSSSSASVGVQLSCSSAVDLGTLSSPRGCENPLICEPEKDDPFIVFCFDPQKDAPFGPMSSNKGRLRSLFVSCFPVRQQTG